MSPFAPTAAPRSSSDVELTFEQSALREELDRARRYLDIADVVLLALNLEGRITFINRKGCQILGWTDAELLGPPVDRRLPPSPDSRRARAKARGSNHRRRLRRRESRPREDGTERLIEWRNRVLRDQLGRVIGTFSSGTDVTEHRRLEERCWRARNLQALGLLAAGVAHDFKNLVTVILGYGELLLEGFGLDDPRREHVIAILSAATSASDLTGRLLAFSRRKIVARTLVDVAEVVERTRPLLDRLIGEEVEVVVRRGGGPSTVMADRGNIEQIVMNLAVNARDAMPRGGTLTIATANVELDGEYALTHRGARPGPHVALTVSDTGTGMTADVRKHLFEPFFTTKDVGKGTGLGLATVQGIVARSGGSIVVETEVGDGTTFTIYLPLASASAADAS
jgi:PAS domain S-box-containing protein